ncbi:MAG: hypothetical protein H6R47_830, partial [Proteobacteria bacterium]|nr:hypothetical protein [Pseudomonadota bacterium]
VVDHGCVTKEKGWVIGAGILYSV